MEFFSTRNESNKLTFKEAIIQGIAPDDGLYVPAYFPKVNIKNLQKMSYKELAYKILSLYLTDFSEQELKLSIEKAYDIKFPDNPIPLRKIGDYYYLELYHGPTFAFKDIALSILPQFIEIARKSLGIKERLMVLTATSGDTGVASLEGFANLESIEVAVFFPQNGVSEMQKFQMTTNSAGNTLVVGIDGNFDDAQKGVKSIFNNKKVLDKIESQNVRFTSANSINIGRLLPQIVYYFHAYNSLVESKSISLGDEISFSVPTGNFGNILALYYAKEMGLPVKKLIVASNENNILTDFFKSGVYDSKRELILTNSPSMDIIISSNLERLLYHKTNISKLVKKTQEDLKLKGEFKFECDFSEFYPGYCNQADTLKIIREVFEEERYLIDTHTAVAKYVADSYRKQGNDEKIVVLSTANPYKFSNAIMDSLGIEKTEDMFEDLERIENYTSFPMPERIKMLKDKEIVHKKQIKIKEIKDTVIKFIGGRNES